MRILSACVVCVALACGVARAELACGARQLWVYCPANLQSAESVAHLESVMKRAAAAGYTQVMLTDSKFARLGDLRGSEGIYFANVAKVKALAVDLKLTIIPVLFSMGWSNNMLWHDPNLAEGLPVSNALFVVKGGAALLVADPVVSLENPSWKDDTVRIEGRTATVVNAQENARFVYTLKLPKYRCYHVAVSIRTEGFTGTPEIKALANGRMLQYQDLGVKASQEWTESDVVFNTLDNENVGLYFGVWGGGAANCSGRTGGSKRLGS